MIVTNMSHGPSTYWDESTIKSSLKEGTHATAAAVEMAIICISKFKRCEARR